MIVRHTIEHDVDYSYSARVHSSVMTLYLRPIQDRRQVVLDFGIETEPSGPLFGFVGPFGNKGHFLDRPSPHERLVIRSHATVEVGPVAQVPDRLGPGPGAWKQLAAEIRSPELWLMLQPSRFVRPSPELDRFLAEQKIERGEDPLQSAIELCSRLHDIFEYTPGSTAVDSPIERILETRRGVCQDYAHVMASILRSWGVPSRYVSGYLGPDASLARPGQSHAWVECWYPELGWTGMDPANNSHGDHRHVRVAVGRDYADVPPTRGVYRGAADSTLKTQVVVTRHQETGGVNA